MSKLLCANFSRLWRSKIFWLCTAAMLGLRVLTIIMNCMHNESGRTFDEQYFRTLPYFSLCIAVFVSMFMGTEYSEQTIRNKVIVGHSKGEIFAANLLTCAAASAIFFIIWALSACAGVPFYGIDNIDTKIILPKLLVSFFTVMALTAVFVTMAQLITSKATGAVAAIFAALALLMAGSYFYNALCEPKTTVDHVEISVDGGIEFGDEVPNPAYIGGKMRNVYEVTLRILPTGQQILIADEPLEQPVFMVVCSVGVIVIAAAAGYLLFRKKDLK